MKLSGRFALLVSLCSLLSGASAQNPISFQIKPDHTGALYSPGMDPPLSLKWSVYIGGTASYPVIAGNKVFVIAAGSPSTLYALDAQTGHILWDQPTPQGIEGGWIGAAYENGMLFLVPGDCLPRCGSDVRVLGGGWPPDLEYIVARAVFVLVGSNRSQRDCLHIRCGRRGNGVRHT